MKVDKQVTVTLTPDEVKELIKTHLKYKGIDVQNINFDVNAHSYPNDFEDRLGSYYSMDQIICTGKEI